MKPLNPIAAALAVTLALSACSGESTDPAASGTPDPELLAPEAMLTPSPSPSPSATTAAQVTDIPTALRGRWALVPADCTSTRGDAKGLLTIGARDLKFYESVGKLKTATSGGAGALSGTFAYTGEGMEWTREVSLAASADGQSLAFSDSGSDAPATRQTYAKCG